METTAAPAVTELFITTGDQECEIHDAAGNTVVTVPRGDIVRFINQTDQDARLIFASNKRLFGVIEAVIYAGEQQEFTIRDDAEQGEHVYRGSCRQTQPGPKIIIPPDDDD